MLSGSKRSALRAMVSTSIWQLGPHCLWCGGEGNDTDLLNRGKAEIEGGLKFIDETVHRRR